ncbi:MAG TPA: adenosine kinase [Bauldia sp.]|nr:adenosine kinase [Bauldia sp.]
MPETRYDVLGIGNAIVDVLATIEDDFLVAERLAKGTMHLIDAERAEVLHRHIPSAIERSGGSAGNTTAGVASLGGRAAFIGKVADDPLGHLYKSDMARIGVHFATAPLAMGAPTAQSMILITPDGERTMNTYLGACQMLGPDDIDPATVQGAAVTYLEGYLWDPPEAKKAFRRAAEIAHAAGRKVSITLSDAFCVDRYRAEFLDLIRTRAVDILFANDSEVKSLYTTSSLEAAVAAVQKDCALTAVTVGADGALVVTPEAVTPVAAAPVGEVVDLTGAGDLFAGGFLYGLTRGMALADAARLGNLAAGEVIGHIGPRPHVTLLELARKAGFAL